MKVNTLQDKFKLQAREERLIRNAIRKAEKLKAVQQAIELKNLEEAKTNEIVKRVAQSMFNPMKRVVISKTGDIAEFSAQDIALKHEGALSTTESIWAPWSQNFKGYICK